MNRFRRRRGLVLGRLIAQIASSEQRGIRILDVGGRPGYWDNVALGPGPVAEIVLLNQDRTELDGPGGLSGSHDIFTTLQGDARDLGLFDDGSFDLVHSNSVIEHVGNWPDMCAMASETRRVGRSGWIQTPAWEFPFEPHFRVPVAHWLGRPVQRGLLRFSLDPNIRRQSFSARRSAIDRVNLLTRREVQRLFPGEEIFIERLALLPKSYCVRWSASGVHHTSRSMETSTDLRGAPSLGAAVETDAGAP